MEETRDPAAHRCRCSSCQQYPDGSVAQRHRAINALLATVDERSRRLVAAVLARQHGRGGTTPLARITGLSRNTIRRGLAELTQPEALASARVRRPGGGRKRGEKKMSATARCPGKPPA
jgi:DNA-binding phage protein